MERLNMFVSNSIDRNKILEALKNYFEENETKYGGDWGILVDAICDDPDLPRDCVTRVIELSEFFSGILIEEITELRFIHYLIDFCVSRRISVSDLVNHISAMPMSIELSSKDSSYLTELLQACSYDAVVLKCKRFNQGNNSSKEANPIN